MFFPTVAMRTKGDSVTLFPVDSLPKLIVNEEKLKEEANKQDLV